jgi:hypothetical protein
MRQRRAVACRHPRQRAGIVGCPQHHHAVFDLAATAIDHGKTLDCALAAGFGDEFRHWPAMAVGLRLHAGVLRQRVPRRLSRQHQPMMFRDKAALAVEQAEFRAIAQAAHHRAGGMRHVGVERRAEERQSARHGRLHVGAEPERPPRHFRHTGKAAVEFDGVERPAVATGEIHHRPEHGGLRVAFEKLVPDQIIPRLFRRSAAPDMNQAVRGDPRRRAPWQGWSSAPPRPY